MRPLSELSDDALARLTKQAGEQLPDAPSWLVESALAMWQAPPVATPEPTVGRRVAALLGFDSWASQPAMALRSGPSAARQLLFNAGDRDIDLRLSATGPEGLFAISGQVLGPGDDGVVALQGAVQALARVPLDDFGEFAFADVLAGTYTVTVQFGSELIVLPDITVGEPAQA